MAVRAEDPKRQEESEASSKPKEPVNKGGTAYIDELPVRRSLHADMKPCSVQIGWQALP